MSTATLLVIRHAKSDWSEASRDDFDRPLNERGRKDVPLLARFLAGSAMPERIIASTALRARQTAEGLAEHLPGTPDLVLDERLYLAPPPTLARGLADAAGQAATVALIAHNPGIETWASELSGASIHLPPGAVACFDMAGRSWDLAATTRLPLCWLLTPKLLKRGLAQNASA